MKIDTNSVISIAEANQNFSRVTKLVDENGAAIILKNNTPRYIIMEFSEVEDVHYASAEEVALVSQRLIEKNIEAYRELAK